MTEHSNTLHLDAALQSRFPELPGFRPGQREAIAALIDGRDVICLLPTGGGKTLVYQLAGAEIGGTTVVTTPLLSLMHDQLRRLRQGDVRVAALSGGARGDRRSNTLVRLAAGKYDFCFATPEQLVKDDVRTALRRADVRLLAVDEAHCISEWGFDFRPAYRGLSGLVAALGHPPVLALTATAPEAVRRDIAAELRLEQPVVIATGFDRPNLHFSVVRVTHPDRRERELAGVMRAAQPPAIVYCTTRREAEETARLLSVADTAGDGQSLAAGAYHGGIGRSLRQETQEAFLDGRLQVLCATSAFGMGIDHPDIRTIVHRTMPDSLESYWQEVGRSGRDGLPTDCVLMYRREDRGVHEHLHRRSRPSEATVARVVHVASRTTSLAHGRDVLAEIASAGKVAVSGAASLLDELERFGYFHRQGERIRWIGEPGAAMDQLSAHRAVQARVDASRLQMMAAYAEHVGCRRRFLLDYLGDEYDADLCLRCDECLRIAAGWDLDDWDVDAQAERRSGARSGPFSRGQVVRHPEWGSGIVQGVEGDVVVVRFDAVGYRSMHAPTVLERGLLASA